jgi:membrane-bound lytic murein transglycosylase D
MDPNHCRCLIKIFFIFFFFSLPYHFVSAKDIDYNEEVVKSRLQQIDPNFVLPKYNKVVKGYIKGYVLRNRSRTEEIIGRTLLYFHIFEKYIKESGLPEELKYLPIVESALNPKAISHAGAVGLWQFMPETAVEQGLKITAYADERCDPHKSTKAAIKYLKYHYEKYNDWALTLAAYNGGGGRVNRAIKRARSKNFWKLRRYLPKETRNYVPAFISVLYLMEYYKEHELEPSYPNLDLQITETVKIFDFVSFYRIAQVTALPLDMIEALNPSYERGFIPADREGNYVCLPKRVMQAFKDYLQMPISEELENHPINFQPVFMRSPADESFFESRYKMQRYKTDEKASVELMAKKLKCTKHQLLAWNQLDSLSIEEGEQIVFYEPREISRFSPVVKIDAFSTLPLKSTDPDLRSDRMIQPTSKQTYFKGKYLYFIPKEKMKLTEIAANFPGISTADLAELNNCKINKSFKAGKVLKIKRL